MYRSLIVTVVVAVLLPLTAKAADSECHYSLRADIALDGDAVELRSDDSDYRLEGNRLIRDGRELSLDARQHAAVNDYRRGMQVLVPQISAISLDGAMLGLEAMTMSFAALSNHPDDLHRYERRTETLAAKLHARYNGRSVLRGGIGDDDTLDEEISDMAEDFASDIGGSVASLVLTALIHPGRIEARADATERLVEQRIQPKAEALAARAQPLCQGFAKLDALEPVMGIDVIAANEDADHHNTQQHPHDHGFSFSF